MTGRPDLESRSKGRYAPPVPLFVTMCTAARTFPPRTMLWYFLAIEDEGVGDGRWRCREDRSQNKRPNLHHAAGATSAAIHADRRANSGHRSHRRRLHSLAEEVGARWATPSTSPPAVSMPEASRTAIAGGAASAAGCMRRTHPRSRPHFASQVASSQTSNHGRQAALSCISVRGRCCRQSSRGLARRCPPCASRGTS